MSAPAMRAHVRKRPEIAANQRQYASKFFETDIRVSLSTLFTFSLRESRGCADLP